ncbi:MAG: hypothetical protein ACI4OL_05885 [Gemmiger sp.]
MKRICLLLAAALMAVSLAACRSSSSGAASQATPAPTASESATSESAASEGGDTAGNEEQPAEPDAELAGMLEEIYAVHDPAISVVTMAVDPTDVDWMRYYTGTEQLDTLDAAVVSEAMIGSQAYSVVLMRAKDEAGAAALAEQVMNSVDPVKWVCVQADDIKAAASGRYAMVAMMDSALAESVTAAQLVDAFRQVTGGELSYEGTRTVAEDAVPQDAHGMN